MSIGENIYIPDLDRTKGPMPYLLSPLISLYKSIYLKKHQTPSS